MRTGPGKAGRVKPGAIPEAALHVGGPRTGTLEVLLPVRKTAPAAALRPPLPLLRPPLPHPAYRKDYIYRRNARDEDGWPHSFRLLTLAKIRQHFSAGILGTIGFRTPTT